MQIGLFRLNDFISGLSLNFISGFFIVFIILVLLFYYVVSMKRRWIVLLCGSMLFLTLGGGLIIAAVPVLQTTIAFFAARSIESTCDNDRKHSGKVILASVSIILITGLVLVKVVTFFKLGTGKFIFPVGISYYSFSIISYLADVYWGRDKAEKNFFKLLLFTSFFPKILQGPISRHQYLGPQLNQGHALSLKNLSFGAELVLWGFFKKIVIADRLSILVSEATNSYRHYGGAIILLALILSCIQLYCDFSGCMDIAGGVCEMLGISLDKNFDRPFSSKSAAEFWRRWHITLGTFFRDYVYMPLSISPIMQKIGKKIKTRFGRKAARNICMILTVLIVWLLTGIWHGTGLNYLIWGLYWGVLIAFSMTFSEKLNMFAKILHIDTQKRSWRGIQIIRTFLIFMIGRIISMPHTLTDSWGIFTSLFTRFRMWELFDGTVDKLGLSQIELLIAFISIVILLVVEHLQGKYQVREEISKWNVAVRSLLYSLAFIAVLVFGVWGPSFDAASFAYMSF